MEIFIRCTVDEDLLQEELKKINCNESDFIQKISKLLSENVIETLDDNQEIFSEIAWSINQPLYEKK